MNIYIVIPAHNEEAHISLMLESLAKQTVLPTKVVVVNDSSTDNTHQIAEAFSRKHNWLSVINHRSKKEHKPGSKVVRAFYKGFETLDENYDIICKFDADIILPENYLEALINLFNKDTKIGIAGGLAYIKKDTDWVYENVADKNHVRGPFKAYRKRCFNAIGGLKESIGWDTVDVLLAQYHDWRVVTNHSLKVKHLKPTGKVYYKKNKYAQGEAFYKLGYSFSIAFIATLKSAYNKRSFPYFYNTLIGFFKSINKTEKLVTKKESKFIRKFRWKGIKQKLLGL